MTALSDGSSTTSMAAAPAGRSRISARFDFSFAESRGRGSGDSTSRTLDMQGLHARGKRRGGNAENPSRAKCSRDLPTGSFEGMDQGLPLEFAEIDLGLRAAVEAGGPAGTNRSKAIERQHVAQR